MRIAIYGAGSLGTVLGAFLERSEIAVDLVTRNQEHVKALQHKGAHVIGTIDFVIPVTALTPDKLNGFYDVIFLLTKQLENDQVAQFLKPFLAAEGVICTLQNGLPELNLVKLLGAQHVLGCAVGWGATLLEPGVVELTSEIDSLVFNLGLPEGGNEAMVETVRKILSSMGTVVVEQNFIGARWSKLLVNASFSGMATVLGTTFGEVAAKREARKYVQLIIKECIDTAHALKIEIEPIQGKDIVRLFDYHNRFKKWFSFMLIPLAMKKHRRLKPSMLQDIEQKKPCEVDAINGIVSLQGKLAQVATPVNDCVVDVIHKIEKGELTPGWQNLCLFGNC